MSSKSAVIISSSPRKGGNSELLAEEFTRGARSAGHRTEIIFLRDLELNFCRGCLACQKTKRCVIRDGADDVLETVRSADVLAFATPVYYYSVSGQLKTFLDRMNPIYAAGHSFRRVYLLAAAAEEDRSAVNGAVSDISGWTACFEGAELAGTVCGIGVSDAGEITGHPEFLAEAYDMGRGI